MQREGGIAARQRLRGADDRRDADAASDQASNAAGSIRSETASLEA